MIISIENTTKIIELDLARFETFPGSTSPRFEPVKMWEKGDDGKNRPTGPQVTVDGVPLWSATARVPDIRYGQPYWRDEEIYVASPARPEIAPPDADFDLFGGDVR